MTNEELEQDGYRLPKGQEDDFQSLLLVGELVREFDAFGHHFYIRTLKSGDYLRIGQLVAQYEGQLGQGKAFNIAIVAASLQLIDGESYTTEILKTSDIITSRFNWIRDNLYYVVVERLFQEYVTLEEKQREVLKSLEGKL